jgi:hypothetical protein
MEQPQVELEGRQVEVKHQAVPPGELISLTTEEEVGVAERVSMVELEVDSVGVTPEEEAEEEVLVLATLLLTVLEEMPVIIRIAIMLAMPV